MTESLHFVEELSLCSNPAHPTQLITQGLKEHLDFLLQIAANSQMLRDGLVEKHISEGHEPIVLHFRTLPVQPLPKSTEGVQLEDLDKAGNGIHVVNAISQPSATLSSPNPRITTQLLHIPLHPRSLISL